VGTPRCSDTGCTVTATGRGSPTRSHARATDSSASPSFLEIDSRTTGVTEAQRCEGASHVWAFKATRPSPSAPSPLDPMSRYGPASDAGPGQSLRTHSSDSAWESPRAGPPLCPEDVRRRARAQHRPAEHRRRVRGVWAFHQPCARKDLARCCAALAMAAPRMAPVNASVEQDRGDFPKRGEEPRSRQRSHQPEHRAPPSAAARSQTMHPVQVGARSAGLRVRSFEVRDELLKPTSLGHSQPHRALPSMGTRVGCGASSESQAWTSVEEWPR